MIYIAAIVAIVVLLYLASRSATKAAERSKELRDSAINEGEAAAKRGALEMDCPYTDGDDPRSAPLVVLLLTTDGAEFKGRRFWWLAGYRNVARQKLSANPEARVTQKPLASVGQPPASSIHSERTAPAEGELSKVASDDTKEICFNLWYYLDKQQNIVAIAAKEHLLKGSEDQKAAALLCLSGDFKSVPQCKVSPVHCLLLGQIGIEDFFAPEFERIQRRLPKGSVVPEERLFFATPLFDFGQGFVPAEIDGYSIRVRADPWFEDPWLDEQIKRLLAIYIAHPNHGTHGSSVKQELRLIGGLFYERGGMQLMRTAHAEFARRCNLGNVRDSSGYISAPRSLEYAWSGIGPWQG